MLTIATEIGYQLMDSGAEIYRVEESIQRILQAYGVETGQVFAIPSFIVASMTTPEGEPITHVRRIHGDSGIDLDHMEAYNALCRWICEELPPPEEIRGRFAQLKNRSRYPMLWQVAAYCLCGGGSAVFWGGGLLDCLGAAACGAAVWLLLIFMEPMKTNLFFKNVVASGFAGLIAVGLLKMELPIDLDKVIIGTFMTLVPGLAITNAVRDIMAGDLMTGLSKLTESIVVAIAIALGAGLVLWLTMGVWQ